MNRSSSRFVYKIRHKVTGLYSTGSSSPQWKKTGKIWQTKAALSNHLSMINQYAELLMKHYTDAEVVEIVVEETEVKKLDVKEYQNARA
jgi:hypothetical protein